MVVRCLVWKGIITNISPVETSQWKLYDLGFVWLMNAALAKWQARHCSSTWRTHLLYAHVHTHTYNTHIFQKKHFKILMNAVRKNNAHMCVRTLIIHTLTIHTRAHACSIWQR